MNSDELIQTYQIKYYQAKTIKFEVFSEQIEICDIALDDMHDDNQP